MDKSIEILLKSIKVSTENLQNIAEETTGTNSCKLDAEKAKRNRALDFICGKGLANEFNNKK